MITLTDFQRKFLKEMNFKAFNKDLYTLFKDPSNKESGYLIFAKREDCYTLIIGDYTVPQDFELDFSTSDCQLRFGLVNDGVSNYQVVNKPVTTFMPAPFIAIEDHLVGHQKWKRHDHYTGVELFVNTNYIENLSKEFKDLEHLLTIPKNQATLYLPLGVMEVLRFLEETLLGNELNPLLLEAKVLESLSLISSELANSDTNVFVATNKAINIPITNERSIQLTPTDIAAINKAHKLISNNLENPPTIDGLCKMLYINEQKLTAGFREIYLMPIGNYLKELRLSTAANLLSSTDLPIEQISSKVGYSHASNFGKAFKSKYKRTPLQFRKFRSQRTNK